MTRTVDPLAVWFAERAAATPFAVMDALNSSCNHHCGKHASATVAHHDGCEWATYWQPPAGYDLALLRATAQPYDDEEP